LWPRLGCHLLRFGVLVFRIPVGENSKGKRKKKKPQNKNMRTLSLDKLSSLRGRTTLCTSSKDVIEVRLRRLPGVSQGLFPERTLAKTGRRGLHKFSRLFDKRTSFSKFKILELCIHIPKTRPCCVGSWFMSVHIKP
jgi:hypothetical protein